MKTLLMAPELFQAQGGIERILRLYLQVLCALAGPGDEVGYVALNDEPAAAARSEHSSSLRLTAKAACSRGKLRFLVCCFRHGWAAGLVVCGHLHQLSVAWLLHLLRPGLKYCLVAHGIEVWRPYSWLERKALRGAHRIFCVSEYTRRQMLRFDPGLDRARLVIVPNTFDPQFKRIDRRTENGGPAYAGLRRGEQRAAPGHGLNLSSPVSVFDASRAPTILVVSRLRRADIYKGIDTMIEALPGVRRQFPGAQLRIVGGGDDEARLRELVRTLQLEAAVQFTGVVSDEALRAEYAACDLFALPSRKEGFGLVYLEAMTYGKPCLAARAGGAPEVVNSAVGALVEYGNTDQIAVAVADLIRHPRDPEAILRRAEEFSFPAFKQRLASVLAL